MPTSDATATRIDSRDNATEPTRSRPRALLVDDDGTVLRAYGRVLKRHGYEVEMAADGESAVAALCRASFDVILSDIEMPGMSGLALIDKVREHDLDVPVVLVTGMPSVDTAVDAVQHGALRYLVKPVELDALVEGADDAVRLHRIAKANRQALELIGGGGQLVGAQAGLVAQFAGALASLYLDYQPIVSWSEKRVFAYEALLRSREPSLPHPGAVLGAAERLAKVQELGRLIRAKATLPMATSDTDALLFINLHPKDLLDPQLFESDTPLTAMASRVVLEVTERASLHEIHDVSARIQALKKLGFRIALDDLGAGYAGLTSLALLEPDVVKLDMALVRGIDREPTKQTLVRTMISMCNELGIIVIAEGIETTGERDELVRAGCDLMQGYLFARPGTPFPNPQL
jgi:EAL domain-containing protein (putative c-di-GMP-specific phosphodiesterase class I)